MKSGITVKDYVQRLTKWGMNVSESCPYNIVLKRELEHLREQTEPRILILDDKDQMIFASPIEPNATSVPPFVQRYLQQCGDVTMIFSQQKISTIQLNQMFMAAEAGVYRLAVVDKYFTYVVTSPKLSWEEPRTLSYNLGCIKEGLLKGYDTENGLSELDMFEFGNRIIQEYTKEKDLVYEIFRAPK